MRNVGRLPSCSRGNVADCTAGADLLAQLPACDILHGDKGYDSNAFRWQIESEGAMPSIPPKANRKWKNCFSPFPYRNRNAIERMFCRLKDFRRNALRSKRRKLPRRRLHRCNRQLLAMSWALRQDFQ